MREVPYDPTKVFQNPLVELTQSSVGTFLTCRQKYVFRYLMQLKPIGLNVPFLVGGAVHSALDIVLSPKNCTHTVEERLMWAEKAIEDKFEKALAEHLIPDTTKFNQGRAQAHAVLRTWVSYYIDSLPFTVLSTEEKVRSRASSINSPLVDRMAGQLDGHVVSKDDPDEHGVLEHKTKYALGNYDWVAMLPVDMQVMWYVKLALDRWHVSISRLYYNVMAKPQHRTGEYKELAKKMFDAMCADTAKYFFFDDPLISMEDVERAYENWGRTVDMMDNLCPKTVTMNNKACTYYNGCAYCSLCTRGADAAYPERVLEIPEIELYSFAPPHEELDGDEE